MVTERVMYRHQDHLCPRRETRDGRLGSKHDIPQQPRAASETDVLHDTDSLERKADHTAVKRILVIAASLRLPQQGLDQITEVAA